MAPRLPPIDVARTPLLVMSEPQKTDLFGAPGHHRQQSVELDNICKRTNKQNYNMVGNGRYGNIQEALHAPEWEAK